MKLSISNIIKRIFPSKESSSPNKNELPLSSQSEIQLRDDDNIESDEGENDEQQGNLIPSLSELANELADDDDEDEDSSSADENTNAAEAEDPIPELEEFTNLSACNAQAGETINTTSVAEFAKNSVSERSDEDENEDSLSIEGDISSPIEDGASSLSIFSLDELAERMEVSHESETKEESSKEKKKEAGEKEKELSRKDLSNQKETSVPKSQVREETSRDEASVSSESDNADLLPDISEAETRLAQLERWNSIAVTRNLTVRQKFLGKEIRKVEAEIDILKKVRIE